MIPYRSIAVITACLCVVMGADHVARAQSIACPEPPPPQIKTHIQEADPVLRHDLSVAELTRKGQSDHDIRLNSPTSHLGGLTDSALRIRSQIRFVSWAQSGNPVTCLAIGNVDINVDVRPTIYIVSEKREGSCPYRAALQHEYKHIATDHILVQDFQPLLEQAVEDELARAPNMIVVENSLRNMRQNEWQARIEQAVTSVFQKLQQERRARQQAIDTPEEYQRVADICR